MDMRTRIAEIKKGEMVKVLEFPDNTTVRVSTKDGRKFKTEIATAYQFFDGFPKPPDGSDLRVMKNSMIKTTAIDGEEVGFMDWSRRHSPSSNGRDIQLPKIVYYKVKYK